MDTNGLGPNGPNSTRPAPPARQRVTVERTYLSLDALPQLRPAPVPSVPVRLQRLSPCPPPAWRTLYRLIGGPWHWHDRDAWDAPRLASHLQRPEVTVYRLSATLPTGVVDDAGFLELERHEDGAIELVYFGIDRACFGLGIGGWFLTEAVRIAFAENATSVWLHTCTLDGPTALPNYLQRGFRIDRTETYETTLAP